MHVVRPESGGRGLYPDLQVGIDPPYTPRSDACAERRTNRQTDENNITFRRKQLQTATMERSLIACSSDMFDIRSNIVQQYDQIFQTYLTITDDDRRPRRP